MLSISKVSSRDGESSRDGVGVREDTSAFNMSLFVPYVLLDCVLAALTHAKSNMVDTTELCSCTLK